MAMLVVPYLVSEYSHNLFGGQFFYEGVVQYYTFFAEHTRKISISLSRTLGAVDGVDVFQAKAYPIGKLLYATT